MTGVGERLQLRGQTVTVLGMGRSGQAAARLALALGADRVICADANPEADAIPGTIADYGDPAEASFTTADLVIVSSAASELAVLQPLLNRLKLAASISTVGILLNNYGNGVYCAWSGQENEVSNNIIVNNIFTSEQCTGI